MLQPRVSRWGAAMLFAVVEVSAGVTGMRIGALSLASVYARLARQASSNDIVGCTPGPLLV